MAKITFLGTASAVPARNHHNTHFILEADEQMLMVDCVGNPVVRLREAGLDPLRITDLVLTHFHPDHVTGTPLLLMDLWLMGRTQPLTVYGLDSVLEQFEAMMALFGWQDWEGLYPIHLHPVPDPEMTLMLDRADLRVWSSTVCHMVPALGLRMALPEGTICYSTDTGPCEAVVRLADGADILIHEASGSASGHSSPAEAGRVASDAGVKTLVLIHYDPGSAPDDLKRQARATFSGEVIVARDLMTLPIG